MFDCNGFKGHVPELSLLFCATECVQKQLAIIRKLDSVCFLEESMKASRFVPQCSTVARQGFVGAFPLENHCIEPSDPRWLEAFCKAKGIPFTAPPNNSLYRHRVQTYLSLMRLKASLMERMYNWVALAFFLMTQSQDGRRHSGDQTHHPESPEPRNLSVEVTRNRSVNHPSIDSKDLPLDAINAETDALLNEQGSTGFRKP